MLERAAAGRDTPIPSIPSHPSHPIHPIPQAASQLSERKLSNDASKYRMKRMKQNTRC